MSDAASEPTARMIGPDMLPVGPSTVVKSAVAPMTKVLNPVIAKLAGRRRFPMAAIQHIGRRSGISYATSVRAQLKSGVVLIPLTFGNQSDWVRNAKAARQCSISLNGRRYRALQPRVVDWAQAKSLVRAHFNPFERFGFRLLGIKQFFRLVAADVPTE